VYVKARPGFIYYPRTTSFPTGHQFVSLSRFAADCGTTIEMKASKRSSFRFDAGITFVRYLQDLDARQALVTSPTYIVTYGNFRVATGYVFSILDDCKTPVKKLRQNAPDGADFVRDQTKAAAIATKQNRKDYPRRAISNLRLK
jgi:hypothetical protein